MSVEPTDVSYETRRKPPAWTPLTDPTRSQFGAYSAAFDYFNVALFNGELPRCLLNFCRHSKRTRGFFAAPLGNSARTHEISLNPDVLKRPAEATMSTLVHEMCHLWQQEFGKPSRSGYHNREWGDKMEAIGLVPSNTGEPGGRKTGQRVTHYIAEFGPFRAAFLGMPREHLLPWISGDLTAAATVKKSPDKVKYTCPECQANVWGKPELAIVCGVCGVAFDSIT